MTTLPPTVAEALNDGKARACKIARSTMVSIMHDAQRLFFENPNRDTQGVAFDIMWVYREACELPQTLAPLGDYATIEWFVANINRKIENAGRQLDAARALVAQKKVTP